MESTTDRAAHFPTPETNQRVFNKATGSIERFTGTGWIVDFVGYPAAVGDSVTDATAAFQATATAIANAGGGVLMIPQAQSGAYFKLTGEITLGSNTMVLGCGLLGELRQTVADKRVFKLANGASDVIIREVAAYGQGGFSNSWADDAHYDRAVDALNATRVTVERCTFRNFALAAVYFDTCTNAAVRGCTILGPANYGTTINLASAHNYGVAVTSNSGGSYSDIDVSNNEIGYVAFGVSTGGSRVRISNNNLHDIKGQHAVYCGASKAAVANNVIDEFGSIGIKVYYGTVGTQKDVTVTGNTIATSLAANAGIEASAAAGGTMRDVVITGNSIRNSHATPTANGLPTGILLGTGVNVRVGENIVDNPKAHGIAIDNSGPITDYTIDGNTIVAPQQYGILCSATNVTRLRVRNNDLSQGTSNYVGINLVPTAGDDVLVAGNTVTGTFFSGLQISAAVTNDRVRGNVFTGYASEPALKTGGGTFRVYEMNDDGFETTVYTATATVKPYDRAILASGAGGAFTLPLPDATKCAGRRFELIKIDASANAVGFAPSNAQVINGTATTSTQYGTVRIRSNGVNWYGF